MPASSSHPRGAVPGPGARIVRRLGPLLGKELRQVLRSRGALLSSTLLPLLLLVVTPGIQYYTLVIVATPQTLRGAAAVEPSPFGLSDDPKVVFSQVLLPLFVALSGLIVPSVAATYTVVGERERRSLDLLGARPPSPGSESPCCSDCPRGCASSCSRRCIWPARQSRSPSACGGSRSSATCCRGLVLPKWAAGTRSWAYPCA